jgi:hypothetical protein
MTQASRIGVHPVDWDDLALPCREEELDPGIRLAVVVLCAGNIETFQSCEGGPGHSFAEPTVEFHGSEGEGYRALAWALSYGLPVSEVRRVWKWYGGALHGATWAMTFTRQTRREDA